MLKNTLIKIDVLGLVSLSLVGCMVGPIDDRPNYGRYDRNYNHDRYDRNNNHEYRDRNNTHDRYERHKDHKRHDRDQRRVTSSDDHRYGQQHGNRDGTPRFK